MSTLQKTTPITRGYVAGMKRALDDTNRLLELARRGGDKGQPEWVPGLVVIAGWLEKMVEQRCVNEVDLPEEERGAACADPANPSTIAP